MLTAVSVAARMSQGAKMKMPSVLAIAAPQTQKRVATTPREPSKSAPAKAPVVPCNRMRQGICRSQGWDLVLSITKYTNSLLMKVL